MWIVELQPNCWLAPWSGDPGRTGDINRAKVFEDQSAARRALRRAQQYRTFARARVVKVALAIREVE